MSLPVGKITVGAAIIAALLVPASAQAASFIYEFNSSVPDVKHPQSAPSSTAPVTAEFEDVTPGQVRLTINTDGLTGNQFVSRLYFNLNPSLNARALDFTVEQGSDKVRTPRIYESRNLNLAIGGWYDIALCFSTGSKGRLRSDCTLQFLISGIPGLTAADFGYLSTYPWHNESYYAAACIQGKGGAWAGSSEINPVPEPGSAMLLALGAGAWLVRRRKHAPAR